MISAYPIGGKIWLVRTDEAAQEKVPDTLPIGSVVLTPTEATALLMQLGGAITKASRKQIVA